MPTATDTPTSPTMPDAEAASERIRELNEQALEFGRKIGIQVLEASEANLKTIADYQEKVADSVHVEWIATAARAQANLTRELANLYGTTGRELLN
jgi:hypothetical protein